MLHKLQFRYNQSQLEELDDEVLDDDVGSSYCPEFMNFVWNNVVILKFKTVVKL